MSAPYNRAMTPKADRELLRPLNLRCLDKLESVGYEHLKLERPWLTLHIVHHLDSEVQNGGFHQFFWNYEGELNEVTQSELELIGAKEFVELFKRAVATATEFEVVETKRSSEGDVDEFVAGYETIPWESLDRAFYETSPTLIEYLARYVRAQASEFE